MSEPFAALADWRDRRANTRAVARAWLRCLVNDGADRALQSPFDERLATWQEMVRGLDDKAGLLAALDQPWSPS